MEKTHTEIVTYENEDKSLAVMLTKPSGYSETTITITKDDEKKCIYKQITFDKNEIRELAEVFNDMIKECLV